MQVTQFSTAFILGFVSGITPGVVITCIFSQILRHGLKECLSFIMIALVSELLLAFCAYSIISHFHLDESSFKIISVVGAGILLVIARKMWCSKPLIVDAKKDAGINKSSLVLVVFTNSTMWLFWLSVCSPLALTISEKISLGWLWFILVFHLGWLIACLFLSIVFHFFRPILLNPKITAGVYKIFSLLFVYLAARLLYIAIKT